MKVEKIVCFLHFKHPKIELSWNKENFEHLNVSFRSFFVKHFLFYHEF